MPSDNYRAMYESEKRKRLEAERKLNALLEQLDDLSIEPRIPPKPESPASEPSAAAEEPAASSELPTPTHAPSPAGAAEIRQALRMAVMQSDVDALEAAVHAALEAGLDHEANLGKKKLAALIAA